VPDGAEPPFSIFLTGHGVAGARRVDAGDAQSDEAPDAEVALRTFARAVHIAPDDPDFHFILGRALIEAGRLVEAVPALRKAAALHPEAAEYRLSLGHALWRAGRFDQAADAFAEAARLQPAEAAAWSGMGAARLAADGIAEALTAIEEALRLDESLTDAASNRGIALWRHGDGRAALEAFEAATRLDPELVFAHRNLGLALLALNRVEEALSSLNTAWQYAPQDAAIHVDLAEALFRLGRDQEAHAAFHDAIEISPSCLDGRPAARAALLALEAASLREELPPERSLLAATLTPLLVAAAFVATAMRHLFFFRRRLTAALFSAVLAVCVYPLWHLAPVYARHYLFVDDLGAVASTPLGSDRDVHERLMHVVHQRGLEDVIDADSCQIASAPRWRTINCRYKVSVPLLPGVRRWLTFEPSVERFYVPVDEPPSAPGDRPPG
jgi:Flp pilus assembly protein TadD